MQRECDENDVRYAGLFEKLRKEAGGCAEFYIEADKFLYRELYRKSEYG